MQNKLLVRPDKGLTGHCTYLPPPAHPFFTKCPPNQPHWQNHMWSAWCRWRKKNIWWKQGGRLFGICIMYSHASRSRQAGCISCLTWMNSAAEHAQVVLSKGQFEPSQTGVEPLIGMLSRFHFSTALFWFTIAVLSLSLSLSPPRFAFCLTSSAVSSLALGKKSSSVIDKNLGLY